MRKDGTKHTSIQTTEIREAGKPKQRTAKTILPADTETAREDPDRHRNREKQANKKVEDRAMKERQKAKKDRSSWSILTRVVWSVAG